MHGAVLDIQQRRGRGIAMIFHQAVVDDDVRDISNLALHLFDAKSGSGERQICGGAEQQMFLLEAQARYFCMKPP